MQALILVAAAIFLPLFPLGMVFNVIFQRARHAWLRSVLLLIWPLSGVGLLHTTGVEVPEWFAVWGLMSAALYGFRAVVIREVGVWSGFLATSAWALSWVALVNGLEADLLAIHVLAFSLPLVLLVFVAAEIERRYEAAYAGIVSGLAQAQPRLAGLFAVTMLAVIGSPMFPAFFALLDNITQVAVVAPVAAIGIAAVWLSWSWSGIRLLQQLLTGPATTSQAGDIAQGVTVAYGMSLLVLLIGGVYISGMML